MSTNPPEEWNVRSPQTDDGPEVGRRCRQLRGVAPLTVLTERDAPRLRAFLERVCQEAGALEEIGKWAGNIRFHGMTAITVMFAEMMGEIQFWHKSFYFRKACLTYLTKKAKYNGWQIKLLLYFGHWTNLILIVNHFELFETSSTRVILSTLKILIATIIYGT